MMKEVSAADFLADGSLADCTVYNVYKLKPIGYTMLMRLNSTVESHRTRSRRCVLLGIRYSSDAQGGRISNGPLLKISN